LAPIFKNVPPNTKLISSNSATVFPPDLSTKQITSNEVKTSGFGRPPSIHVANASVTRDDAGNVAKKRYQMTEPIRMMTIAYFHIWKCDGTHHSFREEKDVRKHLVSLGVKSARSTIGEIMTKERRQFENGEGTRMKPDLHHVMAEFAASVGGHHAKKSNNSYNNLFTEEEVGVLKANILRLKGINGFGVLTVKSFAENMLKTKHSLHPEIPLKEVSLTFCYHFLKEKLSLVERRIT